MMLNLFILISLSLFLSISFSSPLYLSRVKNFKWSMSADKSIPFSHSLLIRGAIKRDDIFIRLGMRRPFATSLEREREGREREGERGSGLLI